MNVRNTRREFLGFAAAAAASAGLFTRTAFGRSLADKPALLGGSPVHLGGWPQWPEWRQAWEPSILEVLRSGKWYRGSGDKVQQFEAAYAKLLGAKRCLATASGTTALLVGMHVLDVDAGDEVIVSPFTFIASYNAVLMLKALPVLADTDPATLTLDPASIESRITERTRAIMPVHIYGMPCDLDPVLAIAKRHRIAVIEDACQAWLAEYKGRMCGTIGDLGCFSFQNSKHLPSGEGGAITGNSDSLVDRAASFHDCGRSYGTFTGARPNFTRGGNFRMQHVQAAMLLQQFDKLVQETARRRENADRLTAALRDIPGIQTVRLPGDSRAVWHLYPFRYDAERFQGLSREKFLRAMRAEGIPCSTGYQEQYFDGLLDEAIGSRGFKRLFTAQRLKQYRDSFRDLPGNRVVCATTVAIPQNLLLAEPRHVDHIADAIRKVQAHAAELAKA
ncbi:MAG TPA: DegT/DnrJ/EryC1/StrS family aminotransferase [Vicinamibacterales bacterium]|nr:DegT/DnrJ/EryC1/StrS family aminotransferase [Vicinamibacterales bacterium]HOG29182.1 DegT/DnrJ/EryC1/StrS family aminotransferase [Vicinamibacterales bacterium]HPK70358.1 DegT/DnrJ/EryC1/StrS family aminotransferase [Vicinamibacterales bacterium]HPW21330.1 DegT/DnrJ/EryC1/StrS family aminotransferase [Vicinamibacterales bacterium]